MAVAKEAVAPDWAGEDPFNLDRLHPDLRACVGSDGWLRHPLVQMMGAPLVNVANQQYEAKRKAIARALKAKDFGAYLAMFEKPYRLPELDRMYSEGILTEAQTRRQLAWVWSNIEFPHQYGDMPLDLFRAVGFTHDIEVADRPKKNAHLHRASDILEWKTAPIFRGQRHGDPYGISWTLDRDMAIWFASRLRRAGEVPLLVSGTVARPRTLGYFTGRGEAEIVVAPEDVTGITLERM